MATLFPRYFALVMATGIIAIGAYLEDLDWLGQGLYVVAALAYMVIALLMTLRLVRYPRLLFADLTSHARGFALLTAVAATNVLGLASAVIHGWWGVAWVPWFSGIALWAILLYVTLIAVVLRSPKPGLERASTAPGSCSQSAPSRSPCWAPCCCGAATGICWPSLAIALTAWALAFAGLVTTTIHSLRRRPRPASRAR